MQASCSFNDHFSRIIIPRETQQSRGSNFQPVAFAESTDHAQGRPLEERPECSWAIMSHTIKNAEGFGDLQDSLSCWSMVECPPANVSPGLWLRSRRLRLPWNGRQVLKRLKAPADAGAHRAHIQQGHEPSARPCSTDLATSPSFPDTAFDLKGGLILIYLISIHSRLSAILDKLRRADVLLSLQPCSACMLAFTMQPFSNGPDAHLWSRSILTSTDSLDDKGVLEPAAAFSFSEAHAHSPVPQEVVWESSEHMDMP